MGNLVSNLFEEDLEEKEIFLSWRKISKFPTYEELLADDHVTRSQKIIALHLAFNQISALPENFFANKEWHSLRELHLDANSLPPLTTQFLPLSPTLTHLSLGANQLPHFPSLSPPPPSSLLPLSLSLSLSLSPSPSPFPFLRVLSLAANKIKIIPEEVRLLEGLEELALGENQIEELGEKCLPESLQILRIQSNRLEGLPSSLCSLTKLKRLDVSENKISALPPDMGSLENLEIFDCRTNRLEVLEEDWLKGWKKVRSLDFSFNFLSIGGPPPFFSLSSPSLKEICLSGNGFSENEIEISFLTPIEREDGTKREEGEKEERGKGKEREEERKEIVKKGVKVTIYNPHPDLIENGLYLGDYPAANNHLWLKKHNITHILTVAAFRPLYPEMLTYKVINVDDKDSENLLDRFDEAFSFINPILEEVKQKEGEEGGRERRMGVFVHCRHGKSRSATVTSAFLMKKYGLGAEEALEMVEKRRPVCPNNGFRAQLKEYEKQLSEKD